ncbi:MAG: chromosomal replication initiator protein DnaA, partial [Hyphomicrobiales bacterium]|nr:chromosomal replication initiator protein DnaA [Hyphomicrobiales bacterium]
LQAIAWMARTGTPTRRVLYLTVERFMSGFVAAFKNQSALAFKDALRDIDLLLIDDMQFLQGKSIQQEFCHLLNALIDSARQVVIACDRPPAELETVDERVRSRLGGGLTVEIGAMESDLRRKILSSRAGLARRRYPGLLIPEPVLDHVAKVIDSNGRDLEGAFNRLVAHNQLTGAPITLDMVDRTIRDLVRTREPRRVKIEDIQRAVAKHFNVSKADLLSSRRTRSVVRPRQIAMYLSKLLTPRSLPEIGRRFGGRDHTTVLHAVRKIEGLMGNDRSLADDVAFLKRLIDDNDEHFS